MVSFWPWRSDETSPASFEKALSSLSAKITKNTSTLDSVRQNSRRFKGLWTLYSIFAYLLCFVVLAFVVGWRKWGAVEYSAVAGGPVLIYIVRLGLTTYYEYRTTRLQDYVDGLVKEREKKIDQLKTATKYNTTQQLLEKYGGTPPKKTTPRKPNNNQSNNNTPRQGPTHFVPPPTANIPGRNLPQSLPNTPQRQSTFPAQSPPFSAVTPPSQRQQQHLPHRSPTAEFAPNAFSSAPQYEYSDSGPKWYDRIMDVLLGEDETSPKNRFALICKNCRLVNGQAPPGVKTLEDVGRWRCSGCGTMNGEESEVKRLVKEIKQQEAAGLDKVERPEPDTKENVEESEEDRTREESSESDVTQYSEVEKAEEERAEGAQVLEQEMEESKGEPESKLEQEVPDRSTRNRAAKASTKKEKN